MRTVVVAPTAARLKDPLVLTLLRKLPPPELVLAQIRRFCRRGIAVGVRRPDMAQWMRHVSDTALRRIEEAHMRLAGGPAGDSPPARPAPAPLKKVA
jgi:hypothetical protein